MKCRGNMKHDLQKNELEAKKLQQQHNAQKGSPFPDEKNNVQKQIDNLLKYTSYTMKRLQHPPARYYLGKRLLSKIQVIANRLGIKFLKKRLIPGTAFFSFLIPVLFLLLGWGGQSEVNKKTNPVEPERVVRAFGPVFQHDHGGDSDHLHSHSHDHGGIPSDWILEPTAMMMATEILPAGTLIIPMDNTLQGNFNMRAYGLAVHLLHAEIPLKWVISQTKGKDGIDFSASARLRYPSTGSYANRDFRAGPIAIFPGFEAQAQAIINSFNGGGTDVNVYELQSSTSVNVYSNLTHKPKVAVFDDGGNAGIHTSIMSEAGLVSGTHYEISTADALTSTSCFTVATEPHSEFDDPTKVTNVRNFVLNGGNFFGQCAAGRSYQGNASGRLFVGSGFVDEMGFSSFGYDNHFEPMAQFQGVIDNEGGSLEDFGFSTDPSGGTRIVFDTGDPDQYKAYVGRLSGVTTTDGGYVHYLGGHNYDGGGIGQSNGRRMLMNAVLRPAERPMVCNLNIGPIAMDDIGTIDCGSSVTINILANDTDPLGGTLTPTLIGSGANGTFVLNGNNTVTYTPNAGTWPGSDMITYEVCNTQSLCSQATINITSSSGDDIVIAGTVFEDTNSDGNLDGGEPGDGGVNVFLYEDNSPMNGVPDGPAIQTATTDGSGEYSFNVNNLVFSQNFMYNQRTGASSNDAEEEVGGKGDGTMNLTSNDVPIGINTQLVGLRFTGLGIPDNSTINSAFLYFDIDDQGKGDVTGNGGAVTIEVQNSNNASAFTSTDFNISSRATTASSVSWTIGAWSENSTNDQSANIATLVQEVVDNNSGTLNNMAVIITNTDVDGYDAIAHDDIAGQAPRLEIDYDAPGGGPYHFIVEVDQSDLPASSSLTTPDTYSLTASSEGTLFCGTDFGYEFICPDPPDAGSDGSTTICEGTGNINLRSIITGEDAGGTWTQASGPSTIPISGNNANFSNANPGTYTFTYTVTATNCPTDMSTATVTVEAALDPGTNGTIDICEGETVTTTELFNALGGSPDAGGTWSPSPAGGGTYTYTHAATANCPAVSAQVVVSEQTAPAAGTNGTLTICEGETVTTAELFSSLGGSPDAGGTWAPSLGGAGTYTYTVSGAPDCPNATAQVVVSEQSAPDAGTNGTLTICEGETVITGELFSSLGGSPDAGGSWSPSLGGAGTYTYTLNGAPDCPNATAQVVVSEQPAPDAGTNGTLTICEGETVTTAELFSSLGGSPDAGGSWSPSLGGAGTYTYTVNGAPDCPNATAQVVVSEEPALDPGMNGTLTICVGETVTTAQLFAALGGSPDTGGSWSPSLGGAGTYTYTHAATANCPAVSAQVVVTEQGILDPGTNGTLTICEGETVTTGELFSSLGGAPDPGGIWTPSLGGAGTYTYTHLAVGSCPETSAQVVVSEQTAPDAGTNGTLTICVGETVTTAQLFAALSGTPDAGGIWTPALAGAGTYTYTHPAVGVCPESSAQVVVTEDVCCPDAPIASIGEVSCVNGSTYEYTFTISPGAIAESANGTISGNTVTVAVGTDDILTVYNQVNCEEVTLSVTSPTSCNIMCEQPDLTLGNSVCNGATYSVAFTETTGATITTGPGTYTITGNIVSNIPIGTDLLLTATNPNDGACAITVSAVSPDDCIIGDPCPDELISVSGLGECAVDFNSYSVYFTLAPGATLTTIPLVGTIGSNVITGIPAGMNITLIATNANCNLTDDIMVIAPNCACPGVNPPTGDDVSYCVGDPIPSILVTVPSGQTVDWYDAPSGGNLLASSTTTYTPGSAGTYYAEAVEISSGCTSTTRTPIVVSEEPVPTINVVPTDPTDCDISNGRIVITATGTTSNLKYSINGGLSFSDNGIFIGLDPGSYDVVVMYGDCMESFGTVTLTAPSNPTVTNVSINNPDDCDSPTGSITVTSSTPVFSTEYSIDGGQTWQVSNIFTGLIAGFYEVYVRNSDGTCPTAGPVVVLQEPIDPILLFVTATDPTGCDGTNGTITAVGGGGEPPYQFRLTGPNGLVLGWTAPVTEFTFTGLSEGKYDIAIRNSNGTCEIDPLTIQLDDVDQPTIVGLTTERSMCLAGGSATFYVDGGETLGSYQYSTDALNWTPATGSFTFTGLPPGVNTLWVANDNLSCPVSLDVTIGNECLELEKSSQLSDTNMDGFIGAGDVITFSFIVTNTGDVPITSVNITDPQLPILSGFAGTLNPGDSYAGASASYTITTADVMAGQYVNQAMASGQNPENMTVNDLSDDPNDPTDNDLEGDGEPDDPTVTLIPNGQPSANDDNVSICEEESINVAVLTNDNFGSNGPGVGAISITVNASNGVATVNNNGTANDPTDDSIDYMPNTGFAGTDMLSYEICDADGDCSTAILTITVEDQLDPGMNGTLSICVGETVTEAALFAALNGTPDAGGVWTPALAGAGTYTYTHTATANCLASSAQVVVTETPGLDAGTNGTLTICEGQTVSEMQLFNALGGTPDAGGIWTPALAGAGTYTYTHPAVGVCPESSAMVTVTAIECSTVAINDINQTAVNVPVNGDVSTNDYDPQGDNQTTTSALADTDGDGLVDDNLPLGVTTTIYGTDDDGNLVIAGTVNLNNNGTYLFTPATDFSGDVPFEYTVTDDNSISPSTDDATVVIEVIPASDPNNNEPPVANDDTQTTEQGISVDGNVMDNDSDPDGDPVTVTSALADTDGDGQIDDVLLLSTSTPIYGEDENGNTVLAGTIILSSNGTYMFTPEPTYLGKVPVDYTISDPGGLMDSAILTILIQEDNGNATYANDDANVGPKEEIQTGNVLDNDNDPEGDMQTINLVVDLASNALVVDGITVNTLPSGGTLVIDTDGSYTYTPATDFVGTEIVRYSIEDDGIPVATDVATLYLTTLPTDVPLVKLNVKVMLQGALLDSPDGLMRDDLREDNIIPVEEPYTSLGFTHVNGGGGEMVAAHVTVFADNGNNSIVDWVLIELRDAADPAAIVATRAALIQRDGDIVDIDGTSTLCFTQSTPASYYVAVRHRNHNGIMTANPIALDNSGVLVDFTGSNLDLFDTAPIHDGNERVLIGGKLALWAGNTNADNKIVFAGQDNDKDPIFNEIDQAPGNIFNLQTYIYPGYFPGDVNMDGRSIFAGQENDVDPIFNNVDGYPANIFKLQTYVIPEQLAE